MNEEHVRPDANNAGTWICFYRHEHGANDPPATRYTTYIYLCQRCGMNIGAVCPDDVTPTFMLCMKCVEAVMSGRVMREHEDTSDAR